MEQGFEIKIGGDSIQYLEKETFARAITNKRAGAHPFVGYLKPTCALFDKTEILQFFDHLCKGEFHGHQFVRPERMSEVWRADELVYQLRERADAPALDQPEREMVRGREEVLKEMVTPQHLFDIIHLRAALNQFDLVVREAVELNRAESGMMVFCNGFRIGGRGANDDDLHRSENGLQIGLHERSRARISFIGDDDEPLAAPVKAN